ncbi:N-acetyltransferase [Mucilaginibacter sabulilitoris]|uniref:N-acetyltransferase n=1 Tax=Mucilaginibacter sabulilitoris TaxID=1173583 RepID=A0ABZ0TKJ1_9SPHI|nr:N-acetyltransferase [Mucilaginibacter sabulilitoris]WPU93339.1 N-acetyltransferase [Mucilaginibacter sabulilitoris]
MKIITQTLLTDLQKESVCKLWNEEYPRNLQYKTISEFDGYLNELSEKKHYLLITEQEIMAAWAVTFKRDNEKWFAIIINSTLHGRGYGTAILNEIKKEEQHLAGWVIDHEKDLKVNGDKYHSPLTFYTKNNFNILPDSRIESEKISAVKISWEKE